METLSKVTYFQRLDSHDFPIGKEGYPNKEILLSWNKEYLKAKLLDLSTLLKKEMGEKAKQDAIHLLSSISRIYCDDLPTSLSLKTIEISFLSNQSFFVSQSSQGLIDEAFVFLDLDAKKERFNSPTVLSYYAKSASSNGLIDSFLYSHHPEIASEFLHELFLLKTKYSACPYVVEKIDGALKHYGFVEKVDNDFRKPDLGPLERFREAPFSKEDPKAFYLGHLGLLSLGEKKEQSFYQKNFSKEDFLLWNEEAVSLLMQENERLLGLPLTVETLYAIDSYFVLSFGFYIHEKPLLEREISLYERFIEKTDYFLFDFDYPTSGFLSSHFSFFGREATYSKNLSKQFNPSRTEFFDNQAPVDGLMGNVISLDYLDLAKRIETILTEALPHCGGSFDYSDGYKRLLAIYRKIL
jgi:hypothetical protein